MLGKLYAKQQFSVFRHPETLDFQLGPDLESEYCGMGFLGNEKIPFRCVSYVLFSVLHRTVSKGLILIGTICGVEDLKYLPAMYAIFSCRQEKAPRSRQHRHLPDERTQAGCRD